MSNRTRNDDVINSLVGDFYSKVGIRKTAADSTSKGEVLGGDPRDIAQGVTHTTPKQTDRGAEQASDLKKSLQDGAIPVAEAQVTSADVMKDPPGQIKRLGVEDTAKELGKVETTTVNDASASEIAKVARAQRLSASILGMIGEMSAQPVQTIQKSAAEVQREQDAMNAFAEFSRGYNRGIQKKAEDIKEVADSGVVPSPAAAEDVLNAVAVQDPQAVLPEEAQPEAGVDPDTAKALDQLAAAMAQEGVTPEQLAEAAKVVQDLQAQGVAPEEIIQAVDQAGAQGGAPGGAPAGGAPAAAEPPSAEPPAAAEEGGKAPIDEANMKAASEARVNHALGRITQYLRRGN